MKEAGSILKKERERKGTSLHEVGMALKINPKTLMAIEEGDPSKLPARTFLRGFIKSYAVYLKLDPAPVLEVFHRESGESAAGSNSPLASLPEDKPFQPLKADEVSVAKDTIKVAMTEGAETTQAQSTPISTRPGVKLGRQSVQQRTLSGINEGSKLRPWLIAASIGLVLCIVIVSRIVDKYSRERHAAQSIETLNKESGSEEIVSEDLNPAATMGTTDSKDANVATTMNSSATLEPSSSPPSTKEVSATKSADVPKPTPIPIPSAPATSVANVQKPSVAASVAAAPSRQGSPTDAPSTAVPPSSSATSPVNSANPAKSTEIIIEALSKVKIRSTAADGTIRNLDLNADQVHTFRSRTPIRLNISDGGSVNVIVDGRDRGVPGKIGQPIELSFPQ